MLEIVSQRALERTKISPNPQINYKKLYGLSFNYARLSVVNINLPENGEKRKKQR